MGIFFSTDYFHTRAMHRCHKKEGKKICCKCHPDTLPLFSPILPGLALIHPRVRFRLVDEGAGGGEGRVLFESHGGERRDEREAFADIYGASWARKLKPVNRRGEEKKGLTGLEQVERKWYFSLTHCKS